MKHSSAIAFCLLATGCSAGTHTGSVAGAAFTPQDAVSASVHFNPTQYNGVDLQALSLGVVLITNTPNACADAKNAISRANQKSMLFFVMSVGATGEYPGEGNYVQDSDGYNRSVSTKATGKYSVGEFTADDENCQHVAGFDNGEGTMAQGTVTLHDNDVSGASGSYIATFESGDSAQGSFSANDCPGLLPSLNALALMLGYDVPLDSANVAQDAHINCKL